MSASICKHGNLTTDACAECVAYRAGLSDGIHAPCPHIIYGGKGTSYCSLNGPPVPATRTEEQAWAEIQGAMTDNMLNMAQKRDFVLAILKGQLANPPKLGGYNE